MKKDMVGDIYADDTTIMIRHTLPGPGVDDDLFSLQVSITAAEILASSWHGRFACSKTVLLFIASQLAEISVQASPLTCSCEQRDSPSSIKTSTLGACRVVFSNHLAVTGTVGPRHDTSPNYWKAENSLWELL